MEYEIFTGSSVDEAVISAAAKFVTTRDNLEYEVIEKGSNGFLGLIGAKPAKIKARVKQEKSIETVEAVKEEAPVQPTEKMAAPVTEEKKGMDEEEKKKIEAITREFLTNVCNAMNLQVEIAIQIHEDMLDVDLSGNEMGILIGKRGQTLDSLQYLVSLVVNKNSSSYVKVKVDTENYRQRRRETLENLAKNIAFKVKRTKRPISLEPMNPFERRVIHSALQNDKYVVTKSEGEEPYRHVVVSLRK